MFILFIEHELAGAVETKQFDTPRDRALHMISLAAQPVKLTVADVVPLHG